MPKSIRELTRTEYSHPTGLKRRDCSLEKTIFQAGCGVEYQAFNQLDGFLDKKVLTTAYGNLTETYYQTQERAKDIEGSLNLPA